MNISFLKKDNKKGFINHYLTKTYYIKQNWFLSRTQHSTTAPPKKVGGSIRGKIFVFCIDFIFKREEARSRLKSVNSGQSKKSNSSKLC